LIEIVVLLSNNRQSVVTRRPKDERTDKRTERETIGRTDSQKVRW
jgi:hypothetical protein